jgi:tRNA 2-thiouridine synthesizing protein E
MSDILKYIAPTTDTDDNGDPSDLPAWSPTAVSDRAQNLGISLSVDHLVVLQFLHQYASEHPEVKHARHFLEAASTAFHTQGGKQYLYRLFPGGPIHQGFMLAGIPIPEDSASAAFGSVH